MFNKITFNSADTSTWPQFIFMGSYNSSIDKPNLTTDEKYGAGLTWVGVEGRDISVYDFNGQQPVYIDDEGVQTAVEWVSREDQDNFWAEGQRTSFTFVNGKGDTKTVTLNWGEALIEGETLPVEENNKEEENNDEEPKPIEGGGDNPAELEDGEEPKEGPIGEPIFTGPIGGEPTEVGFGKGGDPIKGFDFENAPTTGRAMETFVKNLNEKMSAAYQKANELESLINKQRDILKKANSFSDDFTARKQNIQVISEDIESKRVLEVTELTRELDTEHSKGVVINERMSEKVEEIDERKLELDEAGARFAEDSEYKYLKERADRMMLEIDSVKSTRVVDVKSEKKSILQESIAVKQVIARNPIQTKEEVLEKETGGIFSTWTQVEVLENTNLMGPDGQPAFLGGGWQIVVGQEVHLTLGTKYQMSKILRAGQDGGMMKYFLYSNDMNNIHVEDGKGIASTTIGVEWSATEGILSTSDLAEAGMTMEFREVLVDLGKIKFTEKLALGDFDDIGENIGQGGVIEGQPNASALVKSATPAGAGDNTGKILGEE